MGWTARPRLVTGCLTHLTACYVLKVCYPFANLTIRLLVSSHTDVIGTLRPTMKLADRAVDWTTMPAKEAARVVRYSDSSPGCPHTFRGIKYRLFGAHPEGSGANGQQAATATEGVLKKAGAEPGEPIGESG